MTNENFTAHAWISRAAARAHCRLYPYRTDVDDIYQDASVALLGAYRTYQPALGVPFPSWAHFRVRRALIDRWRVTERRRDLMVTKRAIEDGCQVSLRRRRHFLALGASGWNWQTPPELIHNWMPDGCFPSPVPCPETLAAAQEEREIVRSAVRRLPSWLRDVVHQRYWLERPIADIAKPLGVTPSAVSHQLAEAYVQLRQMIWSSTTSCASPAPHVSRWEH